MDLQRHFLELIRRAASELPNDVGRAIESGRDTEPEGSSARAALDCVVSNCRLAASSSRPLCQDTGTNLWYVYHPRSISTIAIAGDIIRATRRATKLSYLRPNAVDSITGKNSGDNTGPGAPVIHFCEWSRKTITADLILKGGGCENVSTQYSLPNGSIKAGRDLEGVRRAVIDAVYNAQGQGCAPGIIGVCIGGDRATGHIKAKEQLFRILTDKNSNPVLAGLEERLFDELNRLGIGPMGFGGKTTVLGVKIGSLHRLPASFFVSVAYMCWACRRASMTIKNGRAVYSQIAETAHIARKGGGKR